MYNGINFFYEKFKIWTSTQKIRTFFGIFLALTSLICLYIGGLPVVIMSLFLISIGANEYKQFMLNIGVSPFFYIITSISFIILVITIYKFAYLIPFVIFFGIFLSFCAILISKRKPYIANIATTILGFLICWLPCHLILLSQLNTKILSVFGVPVDIGMAYLFVLFAAVAATDIGARVIGSKFGRKKLIEEISPHKTIVGSIGGGVCSIITTMILGMFLKEHLLESAFVGALITINAQVGDLSLSTLKRDANLKHSGELFLDYGGILDRLDSFMFSAPILYYYVKYSHLLKSSILFILHKI